MEAPKSFLSRTTNALIVFFALYFTTLFSLDTWAAARGSPYRAPGSSSYNRPAPVAPSRQSYQGRMHGRGNAGPGSSSGGGSRRVAQVKDSRPPIKMGGSAACGACLI
ncbi:hypothetical protein GGP41_010194 [Bipolaris sorokiniana]|uniref:Uncharacterized protein n=2 Tax=Cochliobolus sativus TaxID=45130 RepID=A0A8H5ZKM8_COCSA|nr:uncharacterized protein COCSADRAFT_303732 [Bipolaris sorokiniana ND90Pr]EMD65276.1 hypothetical protein COCSADRAFT_303732 [Bipolaris sorokiniana ND90Pr]KAF5850569.1 hypothetical protein GGP41_010194 [Bipolaris sorokiniana]